MDEKSVGMISKKEYLLWKVYVDGAVNQRGSRVGLVIISPDKIVIEKSLSMGFLATNNEAKYEALLVGITMVQKMGGKNVEMFSNSRLVIGQVEGELEARDPRMQEYLSQSLSRVILVEDLCVPTKMNVDIVRVHQIKVGPSWMDPIVLYLKENILPDEKSEADKDLSPRQQGIGDGCWSAQITSLNGLNPSHYQISGIWMQEDLFGKILSPGLKFLIPLSQIIVFNLIVMPLEDIAAIWVLQTAYPQGNGQADAVNKVRVNGLKKRFDKSKGRWVEELPHVLWTYRTTPRRSIGETHFSITYGAEEVIPLEIGFPTLRTSSFSPNKNDGLLERSLDLIEERRESAMVQLAYYQHKLKQGYDSNVKLRPLALGDLVLRKVLGTAKNLA
ncbi:uncharacterized protein LOC142628745 [Castanea sativa]|uniref:uncharacterized protein LOC142628745 n=1 Tax=Castanea sativa TaxID=21020 RepID=UPI003F64AC39